MEEVCQGLGSETSIFQSESGFSPNIMDSAMDSAPLDRVAVSLQLISSLFSDHNAFSQRALHDSIVTGSGPIDENALAAFLQSAFPSTGFHLQYVS
jgi:hypothetical protein